MAATLILVPCNFREKRARNNHMCTLHLCRRRCCCSSPRNIRLIAYCSIVRKRKGESMKGFLCFLQPTLWLLSLQSIKQF